MDPITAAAAIAAIASIVNTVITRRQDKKIRETHHQVTVNHHSSENPTILDKLSDLHTAQENLNRKFDDHIHWHLNQKR